MAMGKRRRHATQTAMWVATNDLRRSGAHPFYTRLNHAFEQLDFDRFVEGVCQRFYADDGRPGLPPGPQSARSRVGQPIHLPCATFSDWYCRRRRRFIRRFRVRAA